MRLTEDLLVDRGCSRIPIMNPEIARCRSLRGWTWIETDIRTSPEVRSTTGSEETAMKVRSMIP